MSRRQKIIIGSVFVLIALLYSGAALGFGSGQANASGQPGGIVGWLGHVVGQPPAAKRADLTAPCLSGSTFTVNLTCTLTVAKSSTGTRRVKLHALSAVRITSRTPDGTDTASVDVGAGKDVAVTVDGKPTDIVIACAASVGGACTLTLA
jgi:hypothetical protein